LPPVDGLWGSIVLLLLNERVDLVFCVKTIIL
jgi:hypothetical protein